MADNDKPAPKAPNKTVLNREGWLTEAARLMEPLFQPYTLKPYRVTCGWPSVGGLGARARRVGECHALENSRGKVHELFISPVLDDFHDVSGTLAHELAHVAAGIKAGHGRGFVEVCKRVGLTRGKPGSVMPGTLLVEALERALKPLGPYPHKAIVPARKAKKPATVVGLLCTADGCGCKASMPRKWLEVVGVPTCACGGRMRPKDEPDDGGEDDND